ncbi:unnamed protein product [Vicia faba]|uniref:Uncharacterized protein n=1 Tax=Vicia faba TaxID=3906 RepID=A0AAV1AT03_VICFA|nr:unnamed protein product [Vicia faba]
MSDKMSQHLTQDFELFHEDYIIKGKDDNQDGGSPNFEQPTMVQKKKLKKRNVCDSTLPVRILSHMTSVWINENHDRVVGKARIGVLKSSYKMYESDNSLYNIPLVIKFDLVVFGNMSNVPFRSCPMRDIMKF